MNNWRFGNKEIEYVKEAIQTGMHGEMNKRFEKAFADKFRVKYAVAVNSGTSALHCCLAAMGIKKGDEVIVPPLTMAATAFAPILVGATPVFADVDRETFTIDPHKIKEKITERTKAIIPVALYGLPADMDAINEIAEENDLFVVEDSAQCFLGKYKGRLSGTMGDMGIFSLERSKHITSGNGGVIVTNNEELAEKARQFSVLGYSTLKADTFATKPPKEVLQDPEFSRHLFVAPNYRFPELCAAMALAQLERLEEFVKKRIDVAKCYHEVVEEYDILVPQKTPPEFTNVYWTYALVLDKRVNWKEFRKMFLELGGDPFYAAWKINYMEPALIGKEINGITYKQGLCPVAESLQPRLIQLKTNYGTIEEGKKQAQILSETIKRMKE